MILTDNAQVALIVAGFGLIPTLITTYFLRADKRKAEAKEERNALAAERRDAEIRRVADAAVATQQATKEAAVTQKADMREQTGLLVQVHTLVNSKSTQQLRHIARLARVIANRDPHDTAAAAAAAAAEKDLADDEAAQAAAAAGKLAQTDADTKAADLKGEVTRDAIARGTAIPS